MGDPTTTERRHSLHPEPPDGCPEQRVCSDTGCRAARQEWLTKEVLPAFERKMYAIVAGAIGLCAASFVWLHDLSNTKLELKIKDTYEDRSHHDEDIKRMEATVREINLSLAHAMNKILDNQSAIIAKIEEARRK